MNRLLLTISLLFIASLGFARHLKGGFFTYTYLSKTATSITYNVTLTLYMECNASGGQLDGEVNFTFFDVGTGQMYVNERVTLTRQYLLEKGTDEQCITGDQRECYYKIVTYDLSSITLPINSKGYTVSYQRCCRIEGINNIEGSGEIGNTYSINIPGTATAPGAEMNNSARFLINDTVVICGGSEFEYPFVAQDPDNDRLQYEFCDAWIGASTDVPGPAQALAPPYGVVPYQTGFFGGAPLGNNVRIDPNTGLIKGIAPSAPGEYVVTVCVSEYRGNTLVATTRKELHIKIGNCVPIKASLNPEYVNCDGYTLTFQNNAASNDIQTYFWDFGDPPVTNDTANVPVASYTYQDTGVYTIKLVVNRGLACSDSTTALAKVYPGFKPDFSFAGVCVNKPTRFTDQTTTVYGAVNSWSWDFGVTTINTDVSSGQNPDYTFTGMATYNVRLISTSTKGCRDTVTKAVQIIDRPPLDMRFRDTLICNGDALQLEAIGNGIFSWTPAGADITNENTATPTVRPAVTKKYFVQLDDNGCLNQDSVRVRVVDFVTLRARGDTVICATDSVQLSAVTDGLQFQWTPSGTVSNPAIINPMARPDVTTTYSITATIGHCTATDDVVVRLVPYPGVNAGADTVVCYNTPAQLNGNITGTSFAWSPTGSLANSNTLSPVANPLNTTTYILTVRDSVSGCPKPNHDTVVVTVLPKIQAFAGRDTSVVIGQPLQLTASGGVDYEWFPASSLDNPKTATPVAQYDGSFESIRYKVHVFNEASCVDSAFITVKIFKTAPQVFVPTAFTPNSDSRNDVIRPIAIGISKIEYFRVFNRWGEMVFSTTVNGDGWDGKIKGKDQASGTYVWLVKGVDYAGKTFFAKGTATLIR
jgi:gliding motility-associated-like protein